MKYLLLIYGNEAAMEAATANIPPDQQAAEAKVWYEYGDWLKEKGWYLAGEALQPTSTATSVRAHDGKPIVTDGPFAETKEQLGGYYVLDVANADEAIEAGSRCPGAAFGTIELRPIQEFPDQPQG
jgi:hypothetical protein